MIYMELKEFADYCYSIENELPDLEKYLSSLLHILISIEENELTEYFIIEAFKRALGGEVNEYDKEWDKINNKEDWVSFKKDKCLDLLKQQISDLHYYNIDGTLENKCKILGVDKLYYDSWNNFHVHIFFECSSAGLEYWEPKKKFLSAWSLLAEILVLGQIYE